MNEYKRSVLITHNGEAWNADTPEDAKRNALALLEKSTLRDRRRETSRQSQQRRRLRLALDGKCCQCGKDSSPYRYCADCREVYKAKVQAQRDEKKQAEPERLPHALRTCSECGLPGHNKRRCPQVKPWLAGTGAALSAEDIATEVMGARVDRAMATRDGSEALAALRLAKRVKLVPILDVDRPARKPRPERAEEAGGVPSRKSCPCGRLRIDCNTATMPGGRVMCLRTMATAEAQ